MKLNDKGFAFSTILYGALSLIVIVIMLVFALLQYVKNETYYYSTEIEDELNRCVFDEIALENCYTSTSGAECDPTAYYACLGISGVTDGNTGGFIIAEKLKEKVVTTGNGLYQDSNNTKRYVYRGSEVNNYIKYSGLIWRIVSIESDGSIKAVYPGFTDMLPWDNINNGEWSGSSLNNYLNNTFYSTITDTSSLVEKKVWNVGWIYSEVDKTISKLIDEEKSTTYSGVKGNQAIVGLLNVSDFVNASLNSACFNDILGIADCSSWLSNYPTWFINPYGNSEADVQAYYFDNSENKINTAVVTTDQHVLPTVFLDRKLVITSGSGTYANPYIVS